MGTTPDNQTILVSCKIEGAITEAAKFAAAICPAFMQAVSLKWPEKTVVALADDTLDAKGTVIELSTEIQSNAATVSTLRWGAVDQWAKGTARTSDEMTMQVMDGTLAGSMAEQLTRDILSVNAAVIFD